MPRTFARVSTCFQALFAFMLMLMVAQIAHGQTSIYGGAPRQNRSDDSAEGREASTDLEAPIPRPIFTGLKAVLHGWCDEYPNPTDMQTFPADLTGFPSNGFDIKLLIGNDRGTRWYMIDYAAVEGNTAAIDYLVKQGADVNCGTEMTGSTPLYLAMELPDTMQLGSDGNQHNFCLEMTQCLIAHGADVNKAGMVGTPLHAAAKRGYADAIQLLLKNGADINARDAAGNTPLHVAGTFDARDILVQNGADVNAKNRAGITPLHVAAGAEKLDDVCLLLANGADANIRSPRGASAAVWCLLGGIHSYEVARQYEIIRELTDMEVGCANVLRSQGDSALTEKVDQQTDNGSEFKAPILQALLSFGAASATPIERDCGFSNRMDAPSGLKQAILTKYQRQVAAPPSVASSDTGVNAGGQSAPAQTPAAAPETSAQTLQIQNQIEALQKQLDATDSDSPERAQIASELMQLRSSLSASQHDQASAPDGIPPVVQRLLSLIASESQLTASIAQLQASLDATNNNTAYYRAQANSNGQAAWENGDPSAAYANGAASQSDQSRGRALQRKAAVQKNNLTAKQAQLDNLHIQIQSARDAAASQRSSFTETEVAAIESRMKQLRDQKSDEEAKADALDLLAQSGTALSQSQKHQEQAFEQDSPCLDEQIESLKSLLAANQNDSASSSTGSPAAPANPQPQN